MIEVSLWTNSWIARLAAAKLRVSSCAITIGHSIYLHNATREDFLNNTSWYRHELAHIKQYQTHGMMGFLARYVWYSIRFGYYNNPLEIEARLAETDESIGDGFFVREQMRIQ